MEQECIYNDGSSLMTYPAILNRKGIQHESILFISECLNTLSIFLVERVGDNFVGVVLAIRGLYKTRINLPFGTRRVSFLESFFRCSCPL